MTIKSLLRPTNRRIRLAVGLGLLALVCVQCVSRTEAVRETDLVRNVNGDLISRTPGSLAAKVDDLARKDPIGLLKLCLANYDRSVRDFTCTLLKRERIDGEEGQTQEIRVKFLDRPFSVAMRWVKNAPISDRCLYVEGQHDGNMLVRPKGLLSWVGTVKRKPDSKEVMANTLRPINLFGFRRGLQSLLDVYERAAQRGDLKARCGGYADVAGRRAVVLERVLPPREDYPAARTRIYIDTRSLVPVCIEAWNWDGTFQSRYVYKDIKFNTGLTEKDFTPESNGL